jgi:hypothetical protein
MATQQNLQGYAHWVTLHALTEPVVLYRRITTQSETR